jgi:hypothetical protein
MFTCSHVDIDVAQADSRNFRSGWIVLKKSPERFRGLKMSNVLAGIESRAESTFYR